MKEVKALILCGGFGKRLRPLTETTPKPLLEIRSDFTILDKQILELQKADIKTVFLLIGYLGEKIKQRYGDNWRGTQINYCEEDKPLGTLGGIKNGLQQVDCDVVISNGDIVSDIDVSTFVKKAQSSDSLLTLVTTKLKSPYGILKIEGDKIIGFREKPVLDHFINGGIYYVKKESFPYFLEEYEDNSVEKTVFPKLAEENMIGFYYEDVFWAAIDTIKDLEMTRKQFEKRLC